MEKILIKNTRIVNRGQSTYGDVFMDNGRIEQIGGELSKEGAVEIDGSGCFLMPGIIDDQVHFREPGLTHKASIFTESRAAVAGGITSFMEMPNTRPPAVTQEKLEEKYQIAARSSLANYSFFMGTTNDNLEEVLKTNPRSVCGVKIFMGSSTGNMLVDEPSTLEQLFAKCELLIATHCEDEATVRSNEERYREQYGDAVPIRFHPKIRSVEACLKSSSMAVELARKHGTRLHILHISTRDELGLFDNSIPLEEKRITSEVCVHHLYFNADDYDQLGALVKCNPAIKGREHQESLFPALLDDRLDIIATDHAPHTWEEKQGNYFSAPSGLPLVQHSLNIMLEFHHKGMISLERLVEKMCHAPAVCFQIADRGYLDEGMWADAVLVDPEASWKVEKDQLLYKCGWSPLEGHTFRGKVRSTFVNGNLVYRDGQLLEKGNGRRLQFNR